MIAMADASGHGLGPALMIAETRAVLRSICLRCSDPAEALIEANNFLALDFTSGRFVTCFLGFLDPPSAFLSYASAGQGPVILYGQETGRFEVHGATGPPLAVLSGSGFHPEVRTCHLGHGDFVALVSDGFYESSNPAGEQFGMERLMDVLRDNKDRPAAEIVARAREELARFTQSSQPLDDCTFVILRAE
jgi:serine phosphatase RsbU (regulator of sigma subunit)